MKKYLFLMFMVALGACQDENEVTYSVDPALTTYVDTFYDEATERGVTLPKNLVAEFRSIQSAVEVEVKDGQNYLYVHPTTFQTMGDGAFEIQIYSRLGGLFMKRNIDSEIYFNYTPAAREAMFDELFGL